MNITITIETRVPVPIAGDYRGKWADIARAMKPRQSKLLSQEKDAYRLARALGKGKFIWRKVNGSGIRIWKV